MKANPKFWLYQLPTIREPQHSGWARVIIFEDGLVMCASDYGNHTYWWSAPGSRGIREFFATVSDDYLLDKFMYGRERVYDGDATLARVRRDILETRRTSGLTKEQARTYWDELPEEFSDLGDRDDFRRWCESSAMCRRFPDSYEFAVMVPQGEVVGFIEKVMPRLREAIRNELAAEAGAAQVAEAQ